MMPITGAKPEYPHAVLVMISISPVDAHLLVPISISPIGAHLLVLISTPIDAHPSTKGGLKGA